MGYIVCRWSVDYYHSMCLPNIVILDRPANRTAIGHMDDKQFAARVKEEKCRVSGATCTTYKKTLC